MWGSGRKSISDKGNSLPIGTEPTASNPVNREERGENLRGIIGWPWDRGQKHSCILTQMPKRSHGLCFPEVFLLVLASFLISSSIEVSSLGLCFCSCISPAVF